ncbi:S4 domain-containing protein [Aurantiacibacter sp. MUD61]|uniref:S4 domain-containing protein n=1 Tax=Aurantiacibacter sp. MUD61 TaxID=3009083 RepID=UPI0022F03641|nr:S4 domain-containing protein [Aurantiacibacter sp. MUD61]
MRLDLLLCRLRFAKSRSLAQRWIAEGHIRRNGVRVLASDEPISSGDVLTLPIGRTLRVIAIESLPERRGPPAEARSHYHEHTRGA